MASKSRGISSTLAQAIILILAAIIGLYYLSNFQTQIPFNIWLAVELVVVALVGYLAIGMITNDLKRVLSKTSGVERGATVATTFRYMGYIALAFARR